MVTCCDSKLYAPQIVRYTILHSVSVSAKRKSSNERTNKLKKPCEEEEDGKNVAKFANEVYAI